MLARKEQAEQILASGNNMDKNTEGEMAWSAWGPEDSVVGQSYCAREGASEEKLKDKQKPDPTNCVQCTILLIF